MTTATEINSPTPLDDARALIGHKVRSFDFAESWDFPDPADTSPDPAPTHTTGRDVEGERACYVEGIVERITDPATDHDFPDCPRYAIRVERQVFSGEDLGRKYLTWVFPPINGTPNSCDGVQNGVELVAPEGWTPETHRQARRISPLPAEEVAGTIPNTEGA
tara:strand:- start:239 stop:727 length:489 start_codon:yes stop_codon:yes gene_type:complete